MSIILKESIELVPYKARYKYPSTICKLRTEIGNEIDAYIRRELGIE